MIANPPKDLPSLTAAFLDELNRFRSNPKSFCAVLQQRLQFYRGPLYFRLDHPDSAIQTTQGDTAPKQLLEILQSTPPLPPILHSSQLQHAADKHARDLGQSGNYSHQGSDRSTIESRVSPDGSWIGHIIQALECGYREPKDILANLLIDDGLPSRPHRKTLLSPEVKFVGVAIHTHTRYQYIAVLVFSDQDGERKARPNSMGNSIFNRPKAKTQVVQIGGKRQEKNCDVCRLF